MSFLPPHRSPSVALLALAALVASACASEPASSGGEQPGLPRPIVATATLADGRTFEGTDARLHAVVSADGSVLYRGEVLAGSGEKMWFLHWTAPSLEPLTLTLGQPFTGDAGLSTYDRTDAAATMDTAVGGDVTLSFAHRTVTGSMAATPASFNGTFSATLSLECLVPATGNEPGGYLSNEDGTLAETWRADDAMAHPACAALAALAALR